MSKQKLVVFDMDDTLITNNKWVDVNSYLGVSDDDDYKLYVQFKNGEITYSQWMEALHKHYALDTKHITRADITPVLEQITLREGAQELIQHLHDKGYATAIITGSFAITAESIAKQTGIQHVIANTHCVFDDTGRLTHLHSNGTESAMKNKYLIDLCKSLAIDPTTDCYVIGDSIYDQPMFLTTGKGIAFTKATAQLKETALYTVDNFTDLQKLLTALPVIHAGVTISSTTSGLL